MPKKKSNRGGPRNPGPGKTLGRRPLPPGQKRVKCSLTLEPRTKLLAEAIANKRGYQILGIAFDDAIKDLAEKEKVEV